MIKKLAVASLFLCIPWMAQAFSPVQYVQISTNPVRTQSGSFTVQGASITAVLVATGTVSLGGPGNSVTISSNTILPGTTFYQGGNILTGAQITANGYNATGSAVPANGWTESAANQVTFYTNATQALNISAAQAVQMSSNTVMPGATFYQNAPIVISTGINMGSNNITNLNNGVNAQDAMAFGQNKIFQIQTYTTSSSSNTTNSSYILTTLSGSITPTSSSHHILVIANGVTRISGTNLSNQGNLTILRNYSDVTGGGYLGSIIAQVSGQAEDQTSAIIWYDNPATTSSVTYGVGIKTASASNTITFPLTSSTASLILIEVP